MLLLSLINNIYYYKYNLINEKQIKEFCEGTRLRYLFVPVQQVFKVEFCWSKSGCVLESTNKKGFCRSTLPKLAVSYWIKPDG